MHVVQIDHPSEGRRIAAVQDATLRLLDGYRSLYELANDALAGGIGVARYATAALSSRTLDYDAIYSGESDWRILPSFDHPNEPARCLVSGTGLTHRKSAANRDAMHQTGGAEPALTDSMKIYQWGAEGGRPAPGAIGVQPEWFYKGDGSILRAHGEPLQTPGFADDGGEEPEIAGVYIIAADGTPWRVGFTSANEFSDHQMERKNYLYLAPSKLRNCSIGPELVLDQAFDSLRGMVRIRRGSEVVWWHQLSSGEDNMVHTLANLEHHHFKYAAHRRPGDVHIHFFGADAFSFGDGVALQPADVMEVWWDGMGRPLRNPLAIAPPLSAPIAVRTL